MAAKTVKVRIPVLVAPDGRYLSREWFDRERHSPWDDVLWCDCRLSWVEAEVPLPEPAAGETVVQGRTVSE